MEKENQRIAVTRRMLQEGLLKLLERKDLADISITELFRESGVNRATFYRHYETPHDILLEMERILLREQKSAGNVPRSLPEVRAYLEKICTFLNSHMELFRLLIRNNTDEDFYELFLEFFRDIPKESVFREALNGIDPDALAILATYYAGGNCFLLRQWMLGNIQESPEEIAFILYTMLCNIDWAAISKQLGSEPGRK